jgi:hypothetical protein
LLFPQQFFPLEPVQYLENPWGRKGLMAKSRSDFALPLCQGLKRKSHRICMGKSEDLERKARFLARSAKKAPNITLINLALRPLDKPASFRLP